MDRSIVFENLENALGALARSDLQGEGRFEFVNGELNDFAKDKVFCKKWNASLEQDVAVQNLEKYVYHIVIGEVKNCGLARVALREWTAYALGAALTSDFCDEQIRAWAAEPALPFSFAELKNMAKHIFECETHWRESLPEEPDHGFLSDLMKECDGTIFVGVYAAQEKPGAIVSISRTWSTCTGHPVIPFIEEPFLLVEEEVFASPEKFKKALDDAMVNKDQRPCVHQRSYVHFTP